MPWRPSYTSEQAREAIRHATTWSEALRGLGLAVHGKNAATLRRWAVRWGIETDHLPRQQSARRYGEFEARAAIGASRSWSQTLRRLGRCPTGGNAATLKRRAAAWGIDTSHFDPHAVSNEALRRSMKRVPLEEVLVRGSAYSRSNLKRRLYEEGLKEPVCEMCGQGDVWRGKRIGLILDHVNGVRDDNRIENLRIVCPNCAATLDTHCGRKNRVEVLPRDCSHCGRTFQPRDPRQRYCSRYCGSRWKRDRAPRPETRKVERPPEDQLLREIEELGYLEVGRRYGVSDNAVRKWVRAYARERAVAEGRDPDVVEIPTRTWPNRRREAA
ncbi:MAG: HNH endonuclease [Solirubrobacterales bacterium]